MEAVFNSHRDWHPARQCAGTNSEGERCRRQPIPGGTVCINHGGRAPQTIAAAKRRLLEGVEPAIARLLRFIESPPGLCEACGRCDDTSAIVSAIRTLLDRAGLHPSLSVRYEHAARAPSWTRWLTDEELQQMFSLTEVAKERQENGAPMPLPEADDGIFVEEEPIQKLVVQNPVPIHTPDNSIEDVSD